jgi:hypothetical protein
MQGNKQPREDEWQRAMREASDLPQASIVDLDPEDPAQLLDDAGQFSVVDVDLEVDAEPQAEADAELDAAVATTAEDYIEVIDDTDVEGVGDLYGVHVPKSADAGNMDLTQDGESFQDSELGEHVFETLEKKLAESGTAADKGSGGPAGL